MASPAKKAAGGGTDYVRLQRLIFSRWINQKLQTTRGITINDIVTDGKTGIPYVALLEVLSEKKCTAKFTAAPKQRVQEIENCNNALQFCWDCGVELKLKPQGTDLVDQNEKNVLGLVWAIMLKFLKFGDDTAALNAKDALLLWVQNQTKTYPGVEVKGFGKDFHNGLALCAIIHKHRPKLINWESLKPENGLQNIKTAMDAAEKYFGLEKYISAEDILKLDESSMVVYVSDYYYGIAEQRKIDLAARRLGKLIKFTEENDALKEQYSTKAKELRGLITVAEQVLGDRTVDNTMAGAKKRNEQFYEWRNRDKGKITKEQLALEALYNNLALRLSHHKRPAFQPGTGLSLQELYGAITKMEAAAVERKVALMKELNRQHDLIKTDSQHQLRTQKLTEWIEAKKAFLTADHGIDSVSAAELQIKLLGNVTAEAAATREGAVKELHALSANLEKEKYEKISEVKGRDSAVNNGMDEVDQCIAARGPELQQALELEQEKERLRLEFSRQAEAVVAWAKEVQESVLPFTQFGNSLADVVAAEKSLAKSENDIKSKWAAKQSEYEATAAKLTELGVQQNNYTEHTVDSLGEVGAGLVAALDERRNKYNAELARQQANDKLCKQFADVAEPFNKLVNDKKSKITNSQEDLAGQLAFVEACLAAVDSDGKPLATIADLDAKIEKAGVMNNIHTNLFAPDLTATWGEYKDFLAAKKGMLEQEIENEKLKGITREQLDEITSNFAMFDHNKDNTIDAKELKACLYSLGEEKTASQIDEIMKKFGQGGAITFEGFKDFMIGLYGDSDTAEECINGFKLINRGLDHATDERLDMIMTEHDGNYIKHTAPKVSGGYNYTAWTHAVYSR